MKKPILTSELKNKAIDKLVTFILSVSLCAVALLTGCSSGSDDPDPVIDNNSLVASFTSIRSNVMETNCALSGCHAGSSAPLGLSLEADVAYSNLVNVMSGQQPDVVRVAPGDPDNSYLIQKLEGTAATGLQMPRNQLPLPTETIQIIRDWIANGALDS